jgi:hypothetical protein
VGPDLGRLTTRPMTRASVDMSGEGNKPVCAWAAVRRRRFNARSIRASFLINQFFCLVSLHS